MFEKKIRVIFENFYEKFQRWIKIFIKKFQIKND